MTGNVGVRPTIPNSERRMKIYDYKLAPNPRRVRVFLAEKGINVPFEEIDIMKGVNRQPEFLKKNSLGGIPVLELDDGRYLAESVAICRYFELLHPEPALFGKGAFEQATIEMWNRRIELALFVPVGMVWAHSHELTRTGSNRSRRWANSHARPSSSATNGSTASSRASSLLPAT